MFEKTINAGVKMIQVLSDWGIKHIYGIPGGSFNSTMDALCHEQKNIKFIQVRHEEVGALAASADAKLTGRVSAVFGSAGPGAVHLLNGLYDAREDHAPVLVLVAQIFTDKMNRYNFQEINENPIFADVSVYNRVVMTASSLPVVIDSAIKEAYEKKGVAVVTIPVDYPQQEIPDTFISNAATFRNSVLLPNDADLDEALKLISKSARPYLYIGRGASEAVVEIKEFSEKFSTPVGSSAFAKGVVPDNYENFVGMSGRVAWKTGNEASRECDLIIFVGSDFPFGQWYFNQDAKFIQIDIDKSKFGRRHHVDVAILGDAKLVLRKLIEKGQSRILDGWLKANQENKRNWFNLRHSFDNREAQQGLMRVEPIYKEIQKQAKDDAIFVVDVGNVTLNSVRHIEMKGTQKFSISGWYATMGYAVPGGIAAQLSYPKRQVFTFSGDGGFAMMMMGIITQVQYQLPVINIVQTNRTLGFIEDEQEDTGQTKFGVKLLDVDFAKVAQGMGAVAYTVSSLAQLAQACEESAKLTDRPAVIDVKIVSTRPLPVEALKLDHSKYSREEIEKFKSFYEIHDLPLLKELLKKY